jgi:hypothetical protein
MSCQSKVQAFKLNRSGFSAVRLSRIGEVGYAKRHFCGLRIVGH